MFIKSLRIKASAFFGDNIQVDFSPKLNCIMGGRGTGKTSLLTILRWAISAEDNLSKDMLGLVNSNLGTGTAEVTFEDEDGNEFTVYRTMIGDDAPTVKDATGEDISFDEFSKRISIDFFPTGAIEDIGIEPRERLRLFDGYIGGEVIELNNQIGITVSQLKQNEIQIKSCRRELNQLKEEQAAFGEIDKDLKKVTEELAKAKADAETKAKFENETKKQARRTLEKDLLDKIRDAILGITRHNDSLRASISAAIGLVADASKLDSPSVKSFGNSAKAQLESIIQLTDQIQKIAVAVNSDLLSTTKAAKEEHARAASAFSNLKQTLDKHRELFQRFNKLSQRATAKKLAMNKIKSLVAKFKSLQDSRNSLASALRETISNRTELRRNRASTVNELLGQKVKVVIREAAINESFDEILRNHLKQLGKRITGAERMIIEVSNPQELASALKDGKAEEYARKCQINDINRIKDWFQTLKDTDIIFDLEACVCEDAPNFLLSVEDDKDVESFKPTEELSIGQRCTAVLPVILEMTKRPLLIDQPENNLDNKYITHSIHEMLHKIKPQRQLIFITHNPNIPVISDSEQNAFLTYYNKQAHVLAAGNINNVKSQIVELLEGGQKAFEMRRELYGY